MGSPDKVAVVGCGGLFSRSLTAAEFWANIVDGTDTSRTVPPGRWRLTREQAVDPRIGAPDKAYSDRGYYIDGVEFGKPLDPVFQLTLRAGRTAWREAVTAPLDPARVGVILGALALPTDGASALSESVIGARIAAHILGRRPESRPVRPHDLLPVGLPAMLLADDLGLRGGAYTLDAACASSLYALKLAVDELLAGRRDAMLAGGLSRPDCQYTQLGFSQLRALSPTGRCAPFDADGDGLLVGEGAGVFVLKRLADALTQGDRIYGVLTAVGLSNDRAGNVLAPASEGQVRAMQDAYRAAGWQPNDVDLIECHATGTPIGDATEYASLRELWAPTAWRPGQCALGAVKANVGHTLTAAGAAGLWKVLLAMQHETLPPTANFRHEKADTPFAGSPFRVLQSAQPWQRRLPGTPRRAAVSGFGFGGTNAHLLVEEYLPVTKSPALQRVFRPSGPSTPDIAIVALQARIGRWSDASELCAQLLSTTGVPAGAIDDIPILKGELHVAPRDLEEMLPQQLLMLKVAARAVAASRWRDDRNLRSGVIIGLGLDPGTTDFHLRWTCLPWAEQWRAERAHPPIPAAWEKWVAALRDCVHQPLTPGRTLGGLASVTASRIAREFGLGGPSFTVSELEASGVQALHLAVRALRAGQLDQAVVGAVDLPAEERTRAAAGDRDGDRPIGEGAVAMVLKRLADARRDGSTVLAAVGPIGDEAAGEAGLTERIRVDPQSPGAGAAAGLVAVARAVTALSRRTLPGRDADHPPQYWLHDRSQGPRRATVTVEFPSRTGTATVLEESAATASSPVGEFLPRGLFAVTGADRHDVLQGVRDLREFVTRHDETCHELAMLWHRQRPPAAARGAACVFLSGDSRALAGELDRRVSDLGCGSARGDTLSVSSADHTAPPGRIAFVYPGSGNHFAGMAREIPLAWPGVLTRQDDENVDLRGQYAPDLFWDGGVAEAIDPRRAMLASVAVGTLVTDALSAFGVTADVTLGYSLGETTSLFATRAWTDRDTMLRRMLASPLFSTELNGPHHAAGRAWGLPTGQAADWSAGVVAATAAEVRSAIRGTEHVYLLIVNTDHECVIGGRRDQVDRVVSGLGAPFVPLDGVSAVHCEIAAEVADAYRDLHTLPARSIPGVDIYSAARRGPYEPTTENCADIVLQQALDTVSFPDLVREAYADGVRVFVEVGPGSSCTRMISHILSGQPHFARSACVSGEHGADRLLQTVAHLMALGRPVDLGPLAGAGSPGMAERQDRRQELFRLPARCAVPSQLPEPPGIPGAVAVRTGVRRSSAPRPADPSPAPIHQLEAMLTARAQAHGAYLHTSQQLLTAIGQCLDAHPGCGAPTDSPVTSRASPSPAFTREQCLQFAVGRIGDVLGPDFAAADSFPTRVRLPDEPLMLVDRILNITGEPLSLTSGQLVTEHDVRAGRWYLDNDRIPACVAIESGQADLFLSAYLGIDLRTRGLAVYRLLDATVTFHGALPRTGAVIRHEIAIDEFFRQGETHLFRFRFESTVNGIPLMTMSDGCAGFFSPAALASGKGLVHKNIQHRVVPPARGQRWHPLLPPADASYGDAHLRALADGRLAECFGPPFDRIAIADPLTIPAGAVNVLHRISRLDTEGGAYRLGFISAEQDIDPQAWYLTCHFVDDHVMPGTLMYEGCLHNLRVFLLRLGWLGDAFDVHFEPVVGVAARLKCRGQVTESTKTVIYEVHVKTIGYRPEPFAIADAYIHADGKAIVEITDISLQLTGCSRADLEALWPKAASMPRYNTRQILAYAEGKPSEAFGEPYRIFDEQRRLARLPRPPFLFLDRITRVDAEPWQMTAGGTVDSEYDVPTEAWYFTANRQAQMPLAMLLEIALQPCGWMAAYLGSALLSDSDLRFRNLGGRAERLRAVTPDSGTLTTAVTVTDVSRSGGMLIQHYSFTVSDPIGAVYRGTTYFGFFTDEALTEQVGIRDARLHLPDRAERIHGRQFQYPTAPPYPDRQFRMIDRVDLYLPDGGASGLGFIEGSIDVDPDAWFFKAHFLQDPVWPGSLGLEGFCQLLKVLAVDRFSTGPNVQFSAPSLGVPHEWVYRGQVLPGDTCVSVQASVTAVDPVTCTVTADGWLSVDGRVIYQINGFALAVTR